MKMQKWGEKSNVLPGLLEMAIVFLSKNPALFVPCVRSPSIEASFHQPLSVCSFLFLAFSSGFLKPLLQWLLKNGAFGASIEEEVEGVPFVFH